MNFRTLVIRSLYFYRRTHLGVLLGTVIGTAVLTGALIVGDSVKHSLKQQTNMRYGRSDFVLSSADRNFRTGLADDLEADIPADVAPILRVNGIAASEGGRLRVHRVQVVGADARFWSIGSTADAFENLGRNQAVINEKLGLRLGLRPGDEFLLRVEKTRLLPGDVPLASRDDRTTALRLTVSDIVDEHRFGRFDLRINQVAPYTVFLPSNLLADRIDAPHRSNTLLVAPIGGQALSASRLDEALADHWDLADAALHLRRIASGELELTSDRVFIDSPAQRAASEIPESREILTYFVNAIRHEESETPYAFVSAPGTPLVPGNMKDDEIILNSWTAADLRADVGDRVDLTYFIPQEGQRLTEAASTFRVRGILPVRGAAADPDLTPMFPGLTDSENCRDWDPGIPIDLDKIRDKDEAYWDRYGKTPKAFVTLAAARSMWANRFGEITAVRFRPTSDADEVASDILARLTPADLGFQFRPARQESMEASGEAVDFGQLFLGLSFFVIVAAMILTGLLFILSIEQRTPEAGSLLALGYPPGSVRKLFLMEGAAVAILGGILGAFAGIGCNHVVLILLRTVWRDIVGTTALYLYLRPTSLLIGGCCGIVLSLGTMALSLKKQTRKSIRELQRPYDATKHVSSISLLISVLCFLGVLAILLMVHPARDRAAANAFWGAGALMLTGTILLLRWLYAASSRRNHAHLNLSRLGTRTLARKRGRSLATIGLMACGVFVIVAVGANRQSVWKNAGERPSGTGGFAFYAETTLPVLQDANDPQNRSLLGISADEFRGVSFVPIRVREGDDASCLNLNRIRKPRVLGLDPQALTDRGAFSFAELSPEVEGESPWMALEQDLGGDVIPAIADQTVIVWGLGKSVGDTLTYTDEYGSDLHFKLVGGLANSIFQGNLLIAEDAFTRHFPSVSGAGAFLIDAPASREVRSDLANILSRTLQDSGIELTPAAERLAAFNVVTNTYLTIFLALGGLGLIIGTIGMGVIVFRNVMERRSELALLRAVGYSLPSVRRLLMTEHLSLLAVGIAAGTLSALIAVLPALMAPGVDIPYAFIGITILTILASGVLWILLATHLATQRDLIPALRNE